MIQLLTAIDCEIQRLEDELRGKTGMFHHLQGPDDPAAVWVVERADKVLRQIDGLKTFYLRMPDLLCPIEMIHTAARIAGEKLLLHPNTPDSKEYDENPS